MIGRARLRELVERAGPYWAGEAEIASTYFTSAARSPATDRLWLRRQCYKELWGSGVGDRRRGLFQAQAAFLHGVFPRIDRGIDRHAVLEAIDALRGEFAHYCLFADIHDGLGGPPLDPQQLEGWAADDELARLRYDCRRRHGHAGDAAVRCTEGGGGSLYVAGMRLAGRGGVDDRIARACGQVHGEEIGHLRAGIAALATAALSADEWRAIAAALERILLQRLHMRNEQFGFPVAAARIRAIAAGDIDAAGFDARGLCGLAGDDGDGSS